MINNINKLKAELIARNIAYEDEMSGCNESEILEIEAIYGKLPLSYRQIISLIGHSAGLLISDSSFYISTNNNIDQIIRENKLYKQYKKEIIENNELEETSDLLKIPEYIFIIQVYLDEAFILTDPQEHKKDSPVYVYRDTGKVEKECSSVWEWIDGLVNTSFDGDRNNISDFRLQGYRKPMRINTEKVIIQKAML